MSTTPPGGPPPDQPDPSQGGQGWSSPPQGGWTTGGPAPQQPPYAGQYGNQGAQPQWGPPPGAAPPANGKALAALIVGILSVLICGPAGIAAVILGNGAKKEIDASAGMQGGRGMAVAGTVLGWIGIAFTVLGILFFITVVAGSV